MTNIDFKYRENGGKTIEKNTTKINIIELLKKDYSYIYESINNSSFKIRLNECDQFKELIFNEKVVGFVTYDELNKSHKLLTNIYILEGYRRYRLFSKEIKQEYENAHRISIYEPNKLLVDVLIKLGYAKQLTDRLLVSAINFYIQLSTAQSNKTEEIQDKLKQTNIYDPNICATLSFKIFNKTNFTVYYTNIRDEDKNKCEIARKNMEENYFEDIVSTIIDQDMEIQRWLFLLRHNLPRKQNSIEEIIGTVDSPSQILKENIEENIITSKEARNIQNQIQLELRTNKVDQDSIKLRLEYLINNKNTGITKKTIIGEYCPYCFENKPFLENYCTTCGYKLFDLDEITEEKYVYEYMLKEKQSYKHSLTGKKEKIGYHNAEYLTKLATFEVIKKLMFHNYGDEIFHTIAREHNLNYKDLQNYMINEEYVTFNMNPKKWENEATNYLNKELKAILKKHNCKISGTKYELIQRIKKEVPLENIQSDILELTQKGQNYFKENRHMDILNNILQKFIYEEYEDYIQKSKNDDIFDNVINFFQKHIEMAIKSKNHDQLVESLIAQSQTYTYTNDFTKFLENEVKIVIINLNMYFIDSHYIPYYKPVEKLSWDVLNDFQGHFTNEQVIDAINNAYEFLDNDLLKVQKYDVIEVFNDIFKHYSLTGINGRIQRKYYKRAYNIIKDSKKRKNNNNVITLDKFF